MPTGDGAGSYATAQSLVISTDHSAGSCGGQQTLGTIRYIYEKCTRIGQGYYVITQFLDGDSFRLLRCTSSSCSSGCSVYDTYKKPSPPGKTNCITGSSSDALVFPGSALSVTSDFASSSPVNAWPVKASTPGSSGSSGTPNTPSTPSAPGSGSSSGSGSTSGSSGSPGSHSSPDSTGASGSAGNSGIAGDASSNPSPGSPAAGDTTVTASSGSGLPVDPTKPKIVSPDPSNPGIPASPSNLPPLVSQSSSGVSPAAIAGSVVGSLAAVALLAVGGFVAAKRANVLERLTERFAASRRKPDPESPMLKPGDVAADSLKGISVPETAVVVDDVLPRSNTTASISSDSGNGTISEIGVVTTASRSILPSRGKALARQSTVLSLPVSLPTNRDSRLSRTDPHASMVSDYSVGPDPINLVAAALATIQQDKAASPREETTMPALKPIAATALAADIAAATAAITTQAVPADAPAQTATAAAAATSAAMSPAAPAAIPTALPQTHVQIAHAQQPAFAPQGAFLVAPQPVLGDQAFMFPQQQFQQEIYAAALAAAAAVASPMPQSVGESSSQPSNALSSQTIAPWDSISQVGVQRTPSLIVAPTGMRISHAASEPLPSRFGALDEEKELGDEPESDLHAYTVHVVERFATKQPDAAAHDAGTHGDEQAQDQQDKKAQAKPAVPCAGGTARSKIGSNSGIDTELDRLEADLHNLLQTQFEKETAQRAAAGAEATSMGSQTSSSVTDSAQDIPIAATDADRLMPENEHQYANGSVIDL
nr:hypothetical protein HK105_001013 [Polyrhizophydium stewartii]